MKRSPKTIAREKHRKKLKGLSAKAIRQVESPVRRPSKIRTPEETAQEQAIFLATLARTANVGASAKAAGVARSYAYRVWRCEGAREYTEQELAQAEVFKELWEEALDNAVDLLEKEAWRRGALGYDRPIVYKGKVVGSYKEYSDRMLELLLKAHRRKKFGDKTEITGEGGGPVSVVRKVERVIVDPKKEDRK